MNKEDRLFLKQFKKLLKLYPSGLGYFLEEEIGEYRPDENEFRHATHKTMNGLVKSMSKFSKTLPNYKIVAADDPKNLLKGWLVYTEIDGKEVAKYFTIHLRDANWLISANAALSLDKEFERKAREAKLIFLSPFKKEFEY